MTTENQTEKGFEDGNDKKSFVILGISSAALFLLTLITVFAIWMMNSNEIKKYNQLAANGLEESGVVKGASTSDPDYLTKIASNLKTSGFVLYGSLENQKTIKQREIFGQAASTIDFVECDPQIKSANSSECVAKGIKIYPTWVSGEKKFEGYHSLPELEKLILDSKTAS